MFKQRRAHLLGRLPGRLHGRPQARSKVVSIEPHNLTAGGEQFGESEEFIDKVFRLRYTNSRDALRQREDGGMVSARDNHAALAGLFNHLERRVKRLPFV